MLVALALFLSPLLEWKENAEARNRANRPPYEIQTHPSWLSFRADSLWQSLSENLLEEIQRRHSRARDELTARLQASKTQLEPADSPDSLDSDRLRTRSVYGLLPEVHVDRGHGAIFPLPIQAPHPHSWFELSVQALALLKRQREFAGNLEESSESLLALSQRLASHHQAIEALATQSRHLQTWVPALENQWHSARSQNRLPRSHFVIDSLKKGDQPALGALREELRPHRILKRDFLPDRLPSHAKATPVELPIATDIADPRFRAEVEGALDTHWNQSPWAKRHGVRFKIRWKSIPENRRFATGQSSLIEHLQSFPEGWAVITTGGLTAHVRSHAMVLGPGKVDARTLGHELGHLLGFEDCYLRTLSGQGWRGLAVLEWNNPFYPDDLMCDNTLGVARALVW